MPTSVTFRALMHMLILLQSLCGLLEEIPATCCMKLSGATVCIFKLCTFTNLSHWLPLKFNQFFWLHFMYKDVGEINATERGQWQRTNYT